VIVVHATFEITEGDATAYDEWFDPLAAVARAEEGCVAYQLLSVPGRPTERVIFEVWDTPESLAAHGAHPVHKEMVVTGDERWGLRDFRVHLWNRADKHMYFERERMG
jgi:quinol monooxygenase YgiN